MVFFNKLGRRHGPQDCRLRVCYPTTNSKNNALQKITVVLKNNVLKIWFEMGMRRESNQLNEFFFVVDSLDIGSKNLFLPIASTGVWICPLTPWFQLELLGVLYYSSSVFYKKILMLSLFSHSLYGKFRLI